MAAPKKRRSHSKQGKNRAHRALKLQNITVNSEGEFVLSHQFSAYKTRKILKKGTLLGEKS